MQEVRVLAKPRKARHKPRPVAQQKTPPTLARWNSVRSGASSKLLLSLRQLPSLSEGEDKGAAEDSKGSASARELDSATADSNTGNPPNLLKDPQADKGSGRFLTSPGSASAGVEENGSADISAGGELHIQVHQAS